MLKTVRLFQRGFTPFAFPQAINEPFCFSALLPAFGVDTWFGKVNKASHSTTCIVVSHYCYSMHFSKGKCWVLFLMLTYHLYTLYGKVSICSDLVLILIGCLFANCWVLRVLYIFWIQTELKRLSDFANTFSHSLDCLFTFLVSFEAEKFQFWWSQIYLFFFFCSSGFWCHTKKRLPNSRSQRFTPIFFNPYSF